MTATTLTTTTPAPTTAAACRLAAALDARIGVLTRLGRIVFCAYLPSADEVSGRRLVESDDAAYLAAMLAASDAGTLAHKAKVGTGDTVLVCGVWLTLGEARPHLPTDGMVAYATTYAGDFYAPMLDLPAVRAYAPSMRAGTYVMWSTNPACDRRDDVLVKTA